MSRSVQPMRLFQSVRIAMRNAAKGMITAPTFTLRCRRVTVEMVPASATVQSRFSEAIGSRAMADAPLAGRIAAITGASSGIGEATAKALSRAGATVALG